LTFIPHGPAGQDAALSARPHPWRSDSDAGRLKAKIADRRPLTQYRIQASLVENHDQLSSRRSSFSTLYVSPLSMMRSSQFEDLHLCSLLLTDQSIELLLQMPS